MLIEVSIENYRSLKDKVTLSFIADGYDSKPDNIFEKSVANSKTIRLLNTIMIFGANGSGKSNIIRSIFELLQMLEKPRYSGDKLSFYFPFLFNSETIDKPVEVQLKFINSENIVYQYTVAFNKVEIKKEELLYWPNGKEACAFVREIDNSEENIHILRIGQLAQEDQEKVKVYSNSFGLAHFSSLSPNRVILSAFESLMKIKVINTLNDRHRKIEMNEVGDLLLTNEQFEKKINSLLRYADLNIEKINSEKINNKDEDPLSLKYRINSFHKFYISKEDSNTFSTIPITDESSGTQTILSLGHRIIETLERGGVLVIDEIETSLHPLLCIAMISIFKNKKLNPKMAQLLFSTHDTNLMDHTLFRRDQIYFTSKNKRGETKLYSMVDFPDLRESNVYEKWYLAGKFGALPNLESIENAF